MGGLASGNIIVESVSIHIASGSARHSFMLIRCSLGVLNVLKIIGGGFNDCGIGSDLVSSCIRVCLLIVMSMHLCRYSSSYPLVSNLVLRRFALL